MVQVMPLNLPEALLLAIIQGITEWLPISSSGHLAIAQLLLGVSPPLFFDILLHFGTLLSVILFMRTELIQIINSLLKFNSQDKYFQFASFLIIASIPTAIIGFAFHDYFAAQFSNPLSIGIALIITGVFLYIGNGKGKNSVTTKSAIIMGIAQGISIMPGISRSGATISSGLLVGVRRKDALKFSFLLSIPAILGATLFEMNNAELGAIPLDVMVIAPLVAALVGYFSLSFLLKFVLQKGLRPFSYYCFAFGLFAISLQYLLS